MPLRAASIMPSYAEWGFCGFPWSNIILRGRWMLESDWLTTVLRCEIIFRETNGERSSRQLLSVLHVHITSPNDFSYFKGLTTAKYPKPTTTLVKQINIVSNMIKTTDHFHVFATKLHFIMYGKHILCPSGSLSFTQAHTNSLHTREHT